MNPGCGADLAVWLTWELAPEIECCDGDHVGLGHFASASFINYPIPVLTASTLHLNNSAAPDPSRPKSALIVPRTGESYWLTFTGIHFGSYPDKIIVTYSTGHDNATEFTCVPSAATDIESECGATVVDGHVTETEVICRTAQDEPVGFYYFTVEVFGQRSMAGVDQLIFPEPAVISGVSGCAAQVGDGTADCVTAGDEIITLTGTYLVEGMVQLSFRFLISLYLFLFLILLDIYIDIEFLCG